VPLLPLEIDETPGTTDVYIDRPAPQGQSRSDQVVRTILAPVVIAAFFALVFAPMVNPALAAPAGYVLGLITFAVVKPIIGFYFGRPRRGVRPTDPRRGRRRPSGRSRP
jgi:hypothetical protein